MASPIRCAGENWEVGESQGWTSKTGFCSHVFKQSRQWKVGVRVGRSGLVALSVWEWGWEQGLEDSIQTEWARAAQRSELSLEVPWCFRVRSSRCPGGSLERQRAVRWKDSQEHVESWEPKGTTGDVNSHLSDTAKCWEVMLGNPVPGGLPYRREIS